MISQTKFIAFAALFSLFAASPSLAGDTSIVDEVRLGVLNHEASLLRDETEEDGADINGEILFKSPDWLKWAGAPRPQLGATVATHDDATSMIYTGLAWDWNFWGPLFVEGSFGVGLHDGETSPSRTRLEMGCSWAFHESASLGYDLTDHHRVMLSVEHASNASLCDENEGLTNVGLRYGYRF